MGRPTWEVKLIKKMWPTRYLSAKAANVGPVGTLMEKALFKDDQMTQIPINKNIEGADQSVALPFSILEEFVREASVRVIMHTCICRDNNRCTSTPSSSGASFSGRLQEGSSRVWASRQGSKRHWGISKTPSRPVSCPLQAATSSIPSGWVSAPASVC